MRYAIFTYYQKPNGQIDESLTVASRVKKNDLSTASIILDFRDQKVIKAVLDGTTVPKDWETVVGYFYQHYQSTFERLLVENGHVAPEPEANPD